MVQEYLPAVTKGDKRVLLLDGKVLGAINRVPRADDLRSNIHVGGSVEPYEVTDAERAIAPTSRRDSRPTVSSSSGSTSSAASSPR